MAVWADSPNWAEVQGVLSRGDRRLAKVLLDIPHLSVQDFWATMTAHGLRREEFIGEQDVGGSVPWYIVESGVSDNFYAYEWRLAERSQTGLSCPPDSAGCLSCGSCDEDWAFRFSNGEPQKPPRRLPSAPTSVPLIFP